MCKRRTDACQHANRSVGQRPGQRKSRSLTAQCYTKQALLTPSNPGLCLSCEEPVSVNTHGGSHVAESTHQVQKCTQRWIFLIILLFLGVLLTAYALRTLSVKRYRLG